MDVRQAVLLAKQEILRVFADEHVQNVGLEEVELDEKGMWRVTIGFSRPWDQHTREAGLLTALVPRSYKVVRINDSTGAVLSIKDRRIEKSLE